MDSGGGNAGSSKIPLYIVLARAVKTGGGSEFLHRFFILRFHIFVIYNSIKQKEKGIEVHSA